MAVSLQKGQRVSLEKVAPGLTAGFIGLGWDVKTPILVRILTWMPLHFS